MNDLRKSVDMPLEVLLDPKTRADEVAEAVKVIRQALDDKPPVKSYCGGRPNYCTPEVTGEVTGDVDAVNISQDRVDETVKSEHEPVAWLDREGRFSYFKHLDSDEPLYTAPPKRDSSSWVGLTDEEIIKLWGSYFPRAMEFYQAIEAKLKEKNT